MQQQNPPLIKKKRNNTMAISLKQLMELGAAQASPQPASSPISVPTNPAQQAGQEINVGMEFTNFERTIASYTENAKNLFQTKLLGLVGNKKVFLRGSKGYGQPIKDYSINVKSISIDFYYERYVVVFKDDTDKEYFLEPGYKIKILGPAEVTPKKEKRKKEPFIAPTPVAPVQPKQVPQV